MNTVVTSKEEILKTSRDLIRQQGWSAVNIRSVATACGVAVGSIYNYFDSKAELIEATVESVWREIFHRSEDALVFEDIQSCIIWMYERMEDAHKMYPGFFTMHSLVFMQDDKRNGQQRMQETWQHILKGLSSIIRQDKRVRQDAFTKQFTPERFAGVLFSLMLSALIHQDYDPSVVLEIVHRTIY